MYNELRNSPATCSIYVQVSILQSKRWSKSNEIVIVTMFSPTSLKFL